MKYIPYPQNSAGVAGFKSAGEHQEDCIFVSENGKEIVGNHVADLKCTGALNNSIRAYSGNKIIGVDGVQQRVFTCFRVDGENIVCSAATVEALVTKVAEAFTRHRYEVTVTI